ncbi:phospholipase C [Microlunatus soli]|uniref:Phospholipase C n=1 Tax=Microlunatus soli TaxID=630515 RepID=A0A1H2APL7_9ACTN|nr:alkaline phosphatase family protein [Microlunatus soli]SDT47516.1 phospholipase C [Microlunatus soli]
MTDQHPRPGGSSSDPSTAAASTTHHRRNRRSKIITAAAVGLVASASLALQACGTDAVPAQQPAQQAAARTTTPIKHLVVIFGENISYDHYFGTYPRAANTDGSRFVAKRNTPKVNNLTTKVKGGGTLLTRNPNGVNPTRLSPSDPQQVLTCDQNHDYLPEQLAYDRGRMDAFPNNVGTAKGTSASGGTCKASDNLAYYDGNTVTALWNYAQQYAMSDNSYSDVFGPSTPGALSLVSGSTGGVDKTAGSVRYATSRDNAAAGQLVADGNGSSSVIADPDPYYDDCASGAQVGLAGRNIGDQLNAKGLSWGWFEGGFTPTTKYSGPVRKGAGYDPTTVTGRAACGASSPIGEAIGGTGQYGTEGDYIPHHQPFQYYASTANPHHIAPASLDVVGTDTQHYTAGKPDYDTANHQYDISTFDDLITAIDRGQLGTDHLPAVSYLKAPGNQDGHAGYSDPLDEQAFIAQQVNAIENSPAWKDTAIVLAYDDSDGWYDHQSATINNPSSTVADAISGDGRCQVDAKNKGRQQKAEKAEPLGGQQGRCGPGPRQPLLVISPYAKSDFVDHHQTQQGSIVRFVEDNWRLNRIPGSTDSIAGSLESMFDFRSHRPNKKLIIDPKTGLARN